MSVFGSMACAAKPRGDGRVSRGHQELVPANVFHAISRRALIASIQSARMCAAVQPSSAEDGSRGRIPEQQPGSVSDIACDVHQ
jgi:hypothetical protein